MIRELTCIVCPKGCQLKVEFDDNNAKKVLAEEFPELAKKITIHLPDESSRRVGQSIAAASLPSIQK